MAFNDTSRRGGEVAEAGRRTTRCIIARHAQAWAKQIGIERGPHNDPMLAPRRRVAMESQSRCQYGRYEQVVWGNGAQIGEPRLCDKHHRPKSWFGELTFGGAGQGEVKLEQETGNGPIMV